jgi:hypothetical protein
MSPSLENMAEQRAERLERTPRYRALLPGEELHSALIFRCVHCHKLRGFNEGCDTGHELLEHPEEDTYLRQVCDYCWASITQPFEAAYNRYFQRGKTDG